MICYLFVLSFNSQRASISLIGSSPLEGLRGHGIYRYNLCVLSVKINYLICQTRITYCSTSTVVALGSISREVAFQSSFKKWSLEILASIFFSSSITTYPLKVKFAFSSRQHFLISSFNLVSKYLLCLNYLPGSVLVVGYTTVNRLDKPFASKISAFNMGWREISGHDEDHDRSTYRALRARGEASDTALSVWMMPCQGRETRKEGREERWNEGKKTNRSWKQFWKPKDNVESNGINVIRTRIVRKYAGEISKGKKVRCGSRCGLKSCTFTLRTLESRWKV